jgi:hypothetical protein
MRPGSAWSSTPSICLGNRIWRSSSTSAVAGLPVITSHIAQSLIVRALLFTPGDPQRAA